MNASPPVLASLGICVSVLISGCGRDAQDAAPPSKAAETQAASTVPGGTAATTAAGVTANAGYRGLRASAILGKEVRNPQGTDIGKINDLIVDMTGGDVRYAILEFDPGVFQGERLFAVPTDQLRMAADRDDLVYNTTRDRLERAGVQRSDWNRTWRDPNYLADLDKTWGVVQPSSGARAHRVSDLLKQDVTDRQGRTIGEIEELVINMADEKVHYAVLEFDPSWAAPEKFYAFPLTAFSQTGARDDVVLDVDRSKIQAMKAFPGTRYTSLNDPAWVVEVDRYFVTELPLLVATRTGQAGGQATGSETVAANSARAQRADRN